MDLAELQFTRAVKDTRHQILDTVWYQVATVFVAAIAGVLVAFNVPVIATPRTQSMWGVIGAVGSAIVLWVIIFCVNFIRAPYKQRNDARIVLVKMLEEKIDSKTLIVPNETSSVSIKISNTGKQPLKCSARLISLKYINELQNQELIDVFDIPWSVVDVKNGELNWKVIPAHEPDFLKLITIDGRTIDKNPNTSGIQREEKFGIGIKLKLWRILSTPALIIVDPETTLEFGIKIFAHNLYSQSIIKTLKLQIHSDKEEKGNPKPSTNPYWDNEIIEYDEKDDINTEIKEVKNARP
jgi:hypothetical protein